MIPYSRILAFREAGAVTRAHTFPHIGVYDIAQHSYNALSLLLCLHPDPPVDLIRGVLWHDTAERWLGDIPAPAKWSYPELERAYRSHEKRILTDLGVPVLDEQNQLWLNAVDALEFYVWTLDQMAIGNNSLENEHRAIMKHLDGMKLPDACAAFYYQSQIEKHKRGPNAI